MDPTQLLTLTRDECMVLSDRLHNDDWGSDGQRVQIYPLLLKVGSLFLELVVIDNPSNPPKEGVIAITQGETWLLRSKIVTGDKAANDALFGVKLLRKLYTILLNFDTAITVEIVDGHDIATTDETRTLLKEYWEKDDAAERSDPNYSDDGTTDPSAAAA